MSVFCQQTADASSSIGTARYDPSGTVAPTRLLPVPAAAGEEKWPIASARPILITRSKTTGKANVSIQAGHEWATMISTTANSVKGDS